MVFCRINCGILGLFWVCAIICCGVCLFGSLLCAAISDRLSVFDQISLASSLPSVLGRMVKLWRPLSVAWLPCPVRAYGVLFFLVGSFVVCCGRTPVGWFCSLPSGVWRLIVSPLTFLEGQRCGSVSGAGFAVVVCVFAVLHCLSSSSQLRAFPGCHGVCSGGGVRVSSPQG